MKDRKLFPQLWGLRFFLLLRLPGPGAAAASPPAAPGAAREKAAAPKASPAPAGRMRRAGGRRVETSSLKFFHCISLKFVLDGKACMLLLSVLIIITMREFPAGK